MSFGQWPRSRSAAASFSAAAARAAAAFSSDTFARMDQSEYRNVEAGTSKIGAHFDLCSPCCSLVCRVAMAAQAMSMVTRFDSSFLCRLGASVELLHHLHDLREERPCIERILMCARVTACRAACAAHSRYGSISRCTRWSRRGSLRLRRVGMIQ